MATKKVEEVSHAHDAAVSSPSAALPAAFDQRLREALDLRDGNTPFPWQQELFARFVAGNIVRSLDIPTGLGKTSVMAIWLAARACGAVLPRRLVYVVDRRAVVDQATEVAQSLRKVVDCNAPFKQALGLDEGRSLPISTLRGQYVDNKEWLEDPASPAIVVGTVDMVGSRLLFEGYGTSRKMRPYLAGLLGTDTLVVLDEAHLVPPFEALLDMIASGKTLFGAAQKGLQEVLPSFQVLSLSATGRPLAGCSFGLQEADLLHAIVKRRLDAPKHLTASQRDKNVKLHDALARHAWSLTDNGTRAVRCIVFCDRRKDASDALIAVEKLAKKGAKAAEIDTALFVGGRRVFEREAEAKRLQGLGFIAGTSVERIRPAFVFATSAGEVGVDLDADHMVSDLVEWERMVQRLGRVNRRGDGNAKVIVVVEPEPTKKNAKAAEKNEASFAHARAMKKPLDHLRGPPSALDVSPGALRRLKLAANEDPKLQAVLDGATTPAPLRPSLSRALVDAWSMTSLKEHTGRPDIEPWLRGWAKDDVPQTSVIWRSHLPARARGADVMTKEIEAFFEAAPPHASEMLETETYRAAEWLLVHADQAANWRLTPPATPGGDSHEWRPDARDVIAIVLTNRNDVTTVWRLDDLAPQREDEASAKRRKEKVERALVGAVLVVDARLGGLDKGLLSDTVLGAPRTVDHPDPRFSLNDHAVGGSSSGTNAPIVRFRIRVGAAEVAEVPVGGPWRERLRFATDFSDDGDPIRWLVVEKWRHDSTTEEDRSSARPQLLDEHHAWTERCATQLARRLALPDDYARMLAIAAGLHDEGKRAQRWQRAFNAAKDGDYAKTRGPLKTALLDGYRHEFGSLPTAENDMRLTKLPPELQELALHLIAAHHGFARPCISGRSCDNTPPSVVEERERAVAMRFARLQRRWGPWGLAWWEALLRAADYRSSRENDNQDSMPPGDS